MQAEAVAQKKEEVRRKLRERRVPSSPFGRVMGFAQLGASLVYGTMSDSVSQYFSPKSAEQDTEKPSNRYGVLPIQYLQSHAFIRCNTLCDSLCNSTATLFWLAPSMHIHAEKHRPAICKHLKRRCNTSGQSCAVAETRGHAGQSRGYPVNHRTLTSVWPSRYITERNAERLADALCRMRGAALKLGQMISIQDENVLPPAVSPWYQLLRLMYGQWLWALSTQHEEICHGGRDVNCGGSSILVLLHQIPSPQLGPSCWIG